MHCFNFITDAIETEAHYRVHQKAIYRAALHPSAMALYDLYGGEGFLPVKQAHNPVLLESPLHFSSNVNVARIHAICSLNQFGMESITKEESFKKNEPPNNGATALYLLPSYFNHSCIPNAQRHYFGDLMVVRAVQRIEKGEEITIAYVGYPNSLEERNKALSKWIKHCDCTLCERDHRTPVKLREKRKTIADQIQNQNLPMARYRTLVKQLDETYPPEYGWWKAEAASAHQNFATKIQKMALSAHSSDSLDKEAIQEEFISLEAQGVRVIDKSLRKSPKTKEKILPISTERVPYYPWSAIMACLMICGGFLSLGIVWRAQRWIEAAIWSKSAGFYWESHVDHIVFS